MEDFGVHWVRGEKRRSAAQSKRSLVGDGISWCRISSVLQYRLRQGLIYTTATVCPMYLVRRSLSLVVCEVSWVVVIAVDAMPSECRGYTLHWTDNKTASWSGSVTVVGLL